VFEAIQYVGTPIALVAFIVAVVAYAYRGRLEERRKLIETAPEQDRGRVLEAALRDFTTIPTDNLTREQRYDLALKLIEERRAKFKMMTFASLAIALLLAAVVVVFTVLPDEEGTGPLTVRVVGPNGPSDLITNGSVTVDAGQSTQTAALSANGEARFENVPDRAFENGVRLTARIPGYQSQSDTTLHAIPNGRVHEIQVSPKPTRVFGTVVDSARRPLGNIVLNFQAGLASDTTDADGNFSVSLPYPPGAQVPVRATHMGVTGLNDQITIPDNAALTLFFTTRT